MPTIATDRPSEKLHLLVESAMDNKNIVSIKNNDIDIKIICLHISLTGPSVYISK
ncbi:hypothetical protein [Photorhabdus bodei]|uniref:hypothetical protein n=1 Tax=Photorhabdus bodei TaxID=2029681 RepID=UPI00142D2279|nr:hypothetical protein [Photorhabdus bodei]